MQPFSHLVVLKGRSESGYPGSQGGIGFKNAPDVPAAIVNALAKAAYRAPANIRRTGLLTMSLSVMLLAQRITTLTCM